MRNLVIYVHNRDYLCELITPYCSARNFRSNNIMPARPCRPGPRLKTYREKCFQFAGPKEWNKLPFLIRESPFIYIFKSRFENLFIELCI